MEDHPMVRVHPPLVMLAAIVTGAALSFLAPLPVSRRNTLRLAGVPFLAAGLAMVGTALRRMRRLGTNVDPHRPATALVTGGPYRFSRNPIYLGLTLGYAGLGLLANSLWFVPFAAAFLLIIQTQVIRFEETYLENKFGEDYRQYKGRVRRWI